MKIDYIQIFGERNSGTNYLHFLLEQNIKNCKVGYSFGWKHGFAKLDKISAKAGENVLFICIVKDPYSWLASMHGKPHHAPQLYGISFDDFIRSEWACFAGDNFDIRDLEKYPILPEQEMLHERDPNSGKRFKNVIQMRTAKLKNLMMLQELNDRVVFVNYEDLLQTPRIKICELCGKYRLKLNGPVQISRGYFGKNPKRSFDRKDYYLQKKYMEIYSEEDLEFVNSELDWDVEKSIGYSMASSKPKLQTA